MFFFFILFLKNKGGVNKNFKVYSQQRKDSAFKFKSGEYLRKSKRLMEVGGFYFRNSDFDQPESRHKELGWLWSRE
jgi:hypothetical protein